MGDSGEPFGRWAFGRRFLLKARNMPQHQISCELVTTSILVTAWGNHFQDEPSTHPKDERRRSRQGVGFPDRGWGLRAACLTNLLALFGANRAG
jgi:hypothetical protein